MVHISYTMEIEGWVSFITLLGLPAIFFLFLRKAIQWKYRFR